MSGIDTQRVAYSVTRNRCTFARPTTIGSTRPPETKAFHGTGFWITFDRSNNIYVTNRHNFDPAMTFPNHSGFTLQKIELEYRKCDERGFPVDETIFYEVFNFEKHMHFADADCAILVNPSTGPWEKFTWLPAIHIRKEDIADDAFMQEKVAMMDGIAFVGFPGNQEADWWDTERNLPIARSANISSTPHKPFSNPSITANVPGGDCVHDVTLVDGLSFKGSSGSMTLLKQKGFPIAGGGDWAGYAAPKLIGIMSGHLKDREPGAEMFQNNPGLSYYTRSTALIKLLKKAGFWPT